MRSLLSRITAGVVLLWLMGGCLPTSGSAPVGSDESASLSPTSKEDQTLSKGPPEPSRVFETPEAAELPQPGPIAVTPDPLVASRTLDSQDTQFKTEGIPPKPDTSSVNPKLVFWDSRVLYSTDPEELVELKSETMGTLTILPGEDKTPVVLRVQRTPRVLEDWQDTSGNTLLRLTLKSHGDLFYCDALLRRGISVTPLSLDPGVLSLYWGTDDPDLAARHDCELGWVKIGSVAEAVDAEVVGNDQRIGSITLSSGLPMTMQPLKTSRGPIAIPH